VFFVFGQTVFAFTVNDEYCLVFVDDGTVLHPQAFGARVNGVTDCELC
jgi:hypothetical protein